MDFKILLFYDEQSVDLKVLFRINKWFDYMTLSFVIPNIFVYILTEYAYRYQ